MFVQSSNRRPSSYHASSSGPCRHTPPPRRQRSIDHLATHAFSSLEEKRNQTFPKKMASSKGDQTIRVNFETTRVASQVLFPFFDRSGASKRPFSQVTPLKITSFSDDLFTYEYMMEKATLRQLGAISKLISMGFPLDSKLTTSLLNHLECYKDQLLPEGSDLALTDGWIRDYPFQIVSTKNTIRVFFPSGFKGMGRSKTVYSLWTLFPKPKKEAVLIMDSGSKETKTELKTLLALKGKRSTVALREVFESRSLSYLIQRFYPETLVDLQIRVLDTREDHEKSLMNDAEKQSTAFQLLDAIAYMHEQGLLHRDIKFENILLDSQNQLALCDFGLSASRVDAKNETGAGSPRYTAIECLQGEPNSPASDVWSVGVILWCLFAEKKLNWMDYLSDESPKLAVAIELMKQFGLSHSRIDSEKDPLFLLFLDIFSIIPKMRPTIFEVKQRLKEILETTSEKSIYERLTFSEATAIVEKTPARLSSRKSVYHSLNQKGAPPELPSRCWETCQIL